MKLSELINIRQEECPKCISFIYNLAHKIDHELCDKMKVFGKELYSLSIVDLFKVEEIDIFYVEGILGSKYLKLWCKKAIGEEEIKAKKELLEHALIEWFSDKFDSDIEQG